MRRKSSWFGTILIAIGSLTLLAVAQERKVAVARSELPSDARRALRETFPDGKIIAIQKEVEGEDPGQYDVDIRSGGKDYEVEISPDGKIIETKEKTQNEEINVEEDKKWTEAFGQENCTFATVGRNRFFILVPGHQLVLQNPEERVVITVLDETKKIGEVQTRVIEEREEENGELTEVSRNFFAICREHGDVFYFGEEVDDYEDGRIVGHSGAWRADEENCRAGILMPGTILLGARHYQEIAPNAMDRAEIVRDDVTMTTPAGTFKNCIRVEETSGLDPDEKCYKTYAPGVGLIQDEDLLLTSYRRAREEKVQLEDLPPAVRVTIEKHAAGGNISEIEKKIVAGAVRYEAEVIRDGKEFDILVSVDGECLRIDKDDEAGDEADPEEDDTDHDD